MERSRPIAAALIEQIRETDRLPMANCVVRMRLLDNGDGTSTVEWSSEFDAGENRGLNAVRRFRQMHQDALDNLGQVLIPGKKT